MLRLLDSETESSQNANVAQRIAANTQLHSSLNAILRTGAAMAIGTALFYAFQQKRKNAEQCQIENSEANDNSSH